MAPLGTRFSYQSPRIDFSTGTYVGPPQPQADESDPPPQESRAVRGSYPRVRYTSQSYPPGTEVAPQGLAAGPRASIID